MANYVYIHAGLPIAKDLEQAPDAGANTVYVSAGMSPTEYETNDYWLAAGLPGSQDHAIDLENMEMYLAAGLTPTRRGSANVISTGLSVAKNTNQSPTSQVNTYYLSSGLMGITAEVESTEASASVTSTLTGLSQVANATAGGSIIPIVMHHRRLMGVS